MLINGSRPSKTEQFFQKENLESFARRSKKFWLKKVMSNQLKLLLPSVEIFMVNSMIFWNFSTRAVKFQTLAIFSWEILSTEDLTPSKHSNSCYALSWSTQLISLSLEEIMKRDKSLPSMDSTTKPLESTEMPTHGSTALRYSTISVLELLLRARSSVFTVVFLLKSKPLTKSDSLIEEWKFLMRVHSAI